MRKTALFLLKNYKKFSITPLPPATGGFAFRPQFASDGWGFRFQTPPPSLASQKYY